MEITMDLAVEAKRDDDSLENSFMKGVRYLCDCGITSVPSRYILPVSDRPNIKAGDGNVSKLNLKLPIIDLAQLQSSNRSQVLTSLSKACKEYGFFQVTNHGIPSEAIRSIVAAGRCFFELPFEEREKYMSADMRSVVRYGTSYNQNKDNVFCWRDFLKLNCHPLSHVLPYWPSSPMNFRQAAVSYASETKSLYMMLVEAIVESLGILEPSDHNDNDDILKEFEDGSQLMVINCYPKCPEPDLTLGIRPHSDYGFLTLLLQDDVEGLQIQYEGEWVTVEPLPNSLVINVGDHLEIFSNGRYKSVLHRVLVNTSRSRISVASLHSLPMQSVVRPSLRLVNQHNPTLYKDTDFDSFLQYVSSNDHERKSFLESRKIALAV